MPRNPDWSDNEVKLIVEDYFNMFREELRGNRYSKTEHRARLITKLNGRSSGSIEMKHCNISAALDLLGLRYIEGYKPRPHAQQILADVVRDYIVAHPELANKHWE